MRGTCFLICNYRDLDNYGLSAELSGTGMQLSLFAGCFKSLENEWMIKIGF